MGNWSQKPGQKSNPGSLRWDTGVLTARLNVHPSVTISNMSPKDGNLEGRSPVCFVQYRIPRGQGCALNIAVSICCLKSTGVQESVQRCDAHWPIAQKGKWIWTGQPVVTHPPDSHQQPGSASPSTLVMPHIEGLACRSEFPMGLTVSPSGL